MTLQTPAPKTDRIWSLAAVAAVLLLLPLSSPVQGFVVTGGYYAALDSTDEGANWKPQMVGASVYFNGVAYGGGTWVAVGQAGAAYTSPDGDTWTPQTTGATTTFTAIAYGTVNGNALFAAVGANTQNVQVIYTSPNGVTWTANPTTLPSNTIMYGITHGTPGGTGTFVAVGYGGIALRSTDGIAWLVQNTNPPPPIPPPTTTTTPPNLMAVAWGGNQYTAVGMTGIVRTSPDGAVWTAQSSGVTQALYGVAYGAGTWVAVGGGGTIRNSPNGVTWTAAAQPTPTPNYSTSTTWYGVAHGNGRWVVVSNSMYANTTSYSSPVVTSTDGAAWQYRPATGYYYYGPRAVSHGNGQFVAAGYLNLIRSSAGLDWIAEHTMARSYYTFGIGYSGSQWIAAGYYGTVFSSDNGRDWVARYTGVAWAYFYDVMWGADRWIALDVYGNSVTSTDGIHWSTVTGTGNNMYALGFRAGQWIAVGYQGAVRTSTDGTTWSSQSAGTSQVLYGVAWGDGNWTAVGGSGTVIASKDGVTWTARTSPTTQYLYDVVYDDNAAGVKWVAVGNGGTVITSTDGVTWTAASTGATGSLWKVVRDGGNWVATAQYPYGLSIRSPDGVTWTSTTSAMPGTTWFYQYGLGSDAVQPFHCLPETQIVGINAPARVAAGGGAWPYAWSAPLSTNINGSVVGTEIKPRYASEAIYDVLATDAKGAMVECTVVVVKNPPPVTSGPMPRCGYSITSSKPDPDPTVFLDTTLYNWQEIDPLMGGGGTPLDFGYYGWHYYSQYMHVGVKEPNFKFNLCGTDYTTFLLGGSGHVCFDNSAPTVMAQWYYYSATGCGYSYVPYNIPSSYYYTPKPAVFGLSGNFLGPGYCLDSTTNSVTLNSLRCAYYKVEGTPGNRVLIYELKGATTFGYMPGQTFQIKLFEGSNCVEVHYKNVAQVPSYPYYNVVAGYQNGGGSLGYSRFYHPAYSSWSHANEAWRACPFGAAPDTYAVNEDQPTAPFDVTLNDNGAGQAFSVTGFTQPVNGTVVPGAGPGEFTYLPGPNRVGKDSFTYTITSSGGGTSTGKVILNVQRVNDPPVFVADTTPILATPSEGTRTIAGWGHLVQPGPATAVDEVGQAIDFVVTSSNPGIFASTPVAKRTGGPEATVGLDPPNLGDYVMLRMTPSGNWGTSMVCVRAQDRNGTATVTDSWGGTAKGDDLQDAEQCVHVTMNAPPVAYFEPSSSQARPGLGITFNSCPAAAPKCSYDPDGAIVQYLWEFGDGATSSLASPGHAFLKPGTYEVRLTVWDASGSRSTVTRTVVIEWAGAGPLADEAGDGVRTLTADAGLDRIVVEGTKVQLLGLQRDAGDSAAFQWTQVEGPAVVLSDASSSTPWFMAPNLPTMSPVDLQFGLRVSQGAATSASDYVVLHVVSSNHVPLADAGKTVQAAPGSQVALDASASADADEDALTYLWEQEVVAGEVMVPLSDPAAARPTFTAPQRSGLLHFRLTVADAKSSSVDHVTVDVRPLAASRYLQEGAEDAGAVGAARPQQDAVARVGVGWMPLLSASLAFLAVAAVAVALVVRRNRAA